MYLSKRQSNSRMPCSIMDKDESSQPTFMRAFSTKERGCNWIAFVSSDGGGLWAKFMSDKLSLAFRRCGLKIVFRITYTFILIHLSCYFTYVYTNNVTE